MLRGLIFSELFRYKIAYGKSKIRVSLNQLHLGITYNFKLYHNVKSIIRLFS